MTDAMELLYNVKSDKQVEPLLTKIYLEVPFKLKDEIKQLGGKWDNVVRKWYITNNDNMEKINSILENYKPTSDNYVKTFNKKLYIHLPFKYKEEAKTKYKGLQFDKEKKQWFIYDNNIDKNEIINIYHKGNFHIEDKPFNMSNNFDTTEINSKLITLDEFLEKTID